MSCRQRVVSLQIDGRDPPSWTQGECGEAVSVSTLGQYGVAVTALGGTLNLAKSDKTDSRQVPTSPQVTGFAVVLLEA